MAGTLPPHHPPTCRATRSSSSLQDYYCSVSPVVIRLCIAGNAWAACCTRCTFLALSGSPTLASSLQIQMVLLPLVTCVCCLACPACEVSSAMHFAGLLHDLLQPLVHALRLQLPVIRRSCLSANCCYVCPCYRTSTRWSALRSHTLTNHCISSHSLMPSPV